MLHRGETVAKSLRTIESHVPNGETAKVLRKAAEGKNLPRYESLDEKFKDLGIWEKVENSVLARTGTHSDLFRE